MEFTTLDLQTWPRGQMFYYFAKMAPTGYSLSVKMDVTKMKMAVLQADIKFFPAYLWLVTRELNKQIEFKVAEKDGQIGYYDTLTPLYASFHDDDKTFSLMWTNYSDNFRTFYDEYIRNHNNFGNNHGVLTQPQTPPPANAYTVSCLPWISFENFTVHSYENKAYYFPSIEAGKIYKQDERLILPLSITCHHATTDGYHVNLFLQCLQEAMNDLTNLI